MEIVIEYVLLENALINFIVLKTVSLLTKEKGRFFVLTACLGGILAVVIPLLYLSPIGYVLMDVGVAILSVCLSFKFSNLKKFLQLFLCFFVTLFLYGGACYFFENAFGISSLLIVLVVVSVVFVAVLFLVKRFNRKKCIENFCFDVQIVVGDKSCVCKGFLDSGNMLFDPITEKPVTLVNLKVFEKLFTDIKICDILMRSEKLKNLKFAHFVSFNTLGQGNKILVFQVDQMVVEKRVFEKVLLGLSLKDFEKTFGTDIILHNNLAVANA